MGGLLTAVKQRRVTCMTGSGKPGSRLEVVCGIKVGQRGVHQVHIKLKPSMYVGWYEVCDAALAIDICRTLAERWMLGVSMREPACGCEDGKVVPSDLARARAGGESDAMMT